MSDNSTTESNTNTQPTTELNDVIYYRERETASFYFKIAYTTHTATIEIPTNICIANFIEFAKAEIYNIDAPTASHVEEFLVAQGLSYM